MRTLTAGPPDDKSPAVRVGPNDIVGKLANADPLDSFPKTKGSRRQVHDVLLDAGKVYHFSRLLTTQDALRLEANCVHVSMPWLPMAALGLLLVPMGGVIISRRRVEKV